MQDSEGATCSHHVDEAALQCLHQQQSEPSDTSTGLLMNVLKHGCIPFLITQEGITLKERLAEQRGSTIEGYLSHLRPLEVCMCWPSTVLTAIDCCSPIVF